MNLIEVNNKDIENLDDKQLTELLIKLLHLESLEHKIPSYCVQGSMNINISDEGEDASICWQGEPLRTNWLPGNNLLFQCKATKMGPAACKKELLRNKTELKKQVENIFDQGGMYVLFCNQSLVTKQKNERIIKFREALKDAGKPYYKNANFFIYDSTNIATWTNKYLAAIIMVLKWNEKTVYNGLQTWREWKGYKENRYKYITDQTIKDYINQLRSHFAEPRQIARIIGLSGIGKTRLALEAFKSPEDSSNYVQRTLSESVVYLDAANMFINELFSTIQQWRVRGLRGTLVIDNCDLALHEQLVREIEHEGSNLSLLTMDFHTEKSRHNHVFIELRNFSNVVIEGIITQQYKSISQEDINRILEIAEGFPQMAVLLAEARLQDAEDIGSLNNDIIVKKLLWGRGEQSEEALAVISSCALFDSIGFKEELSIQRKFVSEKICKVDNDRFYQHIVDFIDKGIIDQRGRAIRVTPRPLAIRLAADWWRRCSPERAKAILLDSMPPGMADKLCDQLSKLSFLKEAKDITSGLCGNQAPFGQAEVLISEKGSRIFRSLVEVNPEATINSLYNAFIDWEYQDFKKIKGSARRNLVQALEKLCFWAETFDKAAKLLLNLAVMENETWGNNATNQFHQLFHVFLSGTQANLDQRHELIEYAIDRNIKDFTVLSIKSLGHSLKTHNFIRASGVENQGGKFNQKEWHPKTWEQVFVYWKKSLKLLVSFACNDDEISKLAKKQIEENFRGLVQFGLMNDLEIAIKKIINVHSFWGELLEVIEEAIEFEGPKIPKEGLEKLKEWRKLLTPDHIGNMLSLYVSTPPWNYKKTSNGYEDLYETEFKELIELIVNDNLDITHYLPQLLHGEQRKGFHFGKLLGEKYEHKEQFIHYCLSYLESKKQDLNPVVLSGFLLSLKNTAPSLFSSTLDKIISNNGLRKYAIQIYRLIEPSKDNLLCLIKEVEKKNLNIKEFQSFSYNSVLSHLDKETIIWFSKEVNRFGLDGAIVALEIIYMELHGQMDMISDYKENLIKILEKEGFFLHLSNNSLNLFAWKSVVKALLSNGKNEELAIKITKEILSFLKTSYRTSEVFEVIRVLMYQYYRVCWPLISASLLSDEWKIKQSLIDLFNGENEEKNVLLESPIPFDFYIKWCEDFPEKAPAILARILPMFKIDNEDISLTKEANFLLDRYPNKDVLSGLYICSRPRSWMGSVIPHLQKQKKLILLLYSHHNPKVRLWAKEVVKALDQDILKEKLREEEETLGFYD